MAPKKTPKAPKAAKDPKGPKAPKVAKAKKTAKKDEVVERIYSKKKAPILHERWAGMQGMPESMVIELFDAINEKKFTEKTAKELIDNVRHQYERAHVQAGEAVGIIAAQSLGEPATQLTLRTKHFAGAVEVSVGSGIQRVEEIVDGRSKAKYPIMTIYLKEPACYDQKAVENFAKKLIDVRIGDVVKVSEDLQENTVLVTPDEDAIKERGINLEELLEKTEKTLALKGRKKKKGIEFSFGREPLLKARRQTLKLLDTRIQGVREIEKTIVLPSGKEWMIKTRGSNLKAVFKLEEINTEKTTTNDIKEISLTMGIEAARNAITNELHTTLKDNGISVDIRHIMLLADLMTFDGQIRGIVRTGITKGKASPFARAAFEETAKHLLDAAFYGEREYLQGVVENIIVGQPIKVGTGTVELVMKMNAIKPSEKD